MFIYNKNKTQEIKNEITKWITSFKPTHFLSIQFPKNIRNENFDTSQESLKEIMIKFQSILLGPKWNKNHLPFIAMAEHNKIEGWHYHIYFYNCLFTKKQLDRALNRLLKNKELPPETFQLDEIDKNLQYTCSYGVKHTLADYKGHFNPDCIIPSCYLFNLDTKNT